MNIQKQHIQIASKLYEMQDTAKRLFGAKYEERVEPMRAAIRKAMESDTRSLMQLGLVLLTAAKDDGAAMMMIGAALVDLAKEQP